VEIGNYPIRVEREPSPVAPSPTLIAPPVTAPPVSETPATETIVPPAAQESSATLPEVASFAPAAAPQPAPTVAAGARQTLSTVTMFRHLEFAAVLTALTVPNLLLWIASGAGTYYYDSEAVRFWISLALAVVTGLLALGSIVVAPISMGRKIGSGALVLLGTTSLAVPFFGYALTNPLIMLWLICLLLAWGISAPYKGMGYIALPIGFVLYPLVSTASAFLPGILSLFGFIILSVACVCFTVFMALKFEAAHARKPERVIVAAASPGMQPVYGMRTNPTSIMALIFALVGFSLVGVIIGHVSLGQINRTGEEGRGMSIAALIIGYVGMVLGIIVVIVYATFIGGIFGLLATLGAY
jgi:hypothetical protein